MSEDNYITDHNHKDLAKIKDYYWDRSVSTITF